ETLLDCYLDRRSPWRSPAADEGLRLNDLDASADQRSDLLPRQHAPNISASVQVEDDDREIVIFAHGNGGGVHDLETLFEHIHVADLVELLGILHDHGVGIVNTVHFGRF